MSSWLVSCRRPAPDPWRLRLFVWSKEPEVPPRTVDSVHQQIRQDVLTENHLEVANASRPTVRGCPENRDLLIFDDDQYPVWPLTSEQSAVCDASTAFKGIALVPLFNVAHGSRALVHANKSQLCDKWNPDTGRVCPGVDQSLQGNHPARIATKLNRSNRTPEVIERGINGGGGVGRRRLGGRFPRSRRRGQGGRHLQRLRPGRTQSFGQRPRRALRLPTPGRWPWARRWMVNVIGSAPATGSFSPRGACATAPQFTLSMDEGFALRDRLAAGETIELSFRLAVEEPRNIATDYTDGHAVRACPTSRSSSCRRHRRVLPGGDRQRGGDGERAGAGALLCRAASAGSAAHPEVHPVPRSPSRWRSHAVVPASASTTPTPGDTVAVKLTMEHPAQTLLYMYNDDADTDQRGGRVSLERARQRGVRTDGLRYAARVRRVGVCAGERVRRTETTRRRSTSSITSSTTPRSTRPSWCPTDCGLERSTRAFAAALDRRPTG